MGTEQDLHSFPAWASGIAENTNNNNSNKSKNDISCSWQKQIKCEHLTQWPLNATNFAATQAQPEQHRAGIGKREGASRQRESERFWGRCEWELPLKFHSASLWVLSEKLHQKALLCSFSEHREIECCRERAQSSGSLLLVLLFTIAFSLLLEFLIFGFWSKEYFLPRLLSNFLSFKS